MAQVHGLVHAVRSTGDHHIAFMEIVQEGNTSDEFEPQIPEKELLRDVETCWDSAYGMLVRAIPAQPVSPKISVCGFLAKAVHRQSSPCIFLQFLHSVQQLMSGKATPVLSGVLPVFQRLQNCWESHAAMHRDISCYVYEGMEWLNKYHEKAGRSPTYVIAMVLNLAIKFSFINKNWSVIEQEIAVRWVKDEV
ncbi:hypothetical protein BS47DRAFT_1435766, partial [Hydnum rufescens UP504]